MESLNRGLQFQGMSSKGGKYNQYSQGSSGWSILKNEEFQEADIWDVRWERKESDSHSTTHNTSPPFILRRQSATAAGMIPKSPGISSSSPLIESNIFQQSSAPISIPDWQRIYGQKRSTDVSWGGGGGRDADGVMNKSSWDSDEEYEDDDRMAPPHEWIARKLARSQISSFSVCEGVGRTLKGRDLSNVRNAVLTKTGFLE